MHTEDQEPSRREQLRTSLQRLGMAALAVAVLATVSGYLFARTTPDRAAAARISGFVVDERDADVAPGGDPAAPTSGEVVGADAVCGPHEVPLEPEEQVAALRAGRVLAQYRPADVSEAEQRELEGLVTAHPDQLVTAPNPALGAPAVVTAWGRRMPLERPDTELITSFLTAYAGRGPEPDPCAAG